jgi:sarcosine oxidase subunit beta
MMLVTLRMPRFLDPVVLAPSLSFKQTETGTVVIGGGRPTRLSLEKEKTFLNPNEMQLSAQHVLRLFPIMGKATVNRGWAGIEGFLPDALPIIGPSLRAKNLFHQFGFSGHGFELGPIVGKVVADLVTKGSSDLPIEPFSIGRFASKQECSEGVGPGSFDK